MRLATGLAVIALWAGYITGLAAFFRHVGRRS